MDRWVGTKCANPSVFRLLIDGGSEGDMGYKMYLCHKFRFEVAPLEGWLFCL